MKNLIEAIASILKGEDDIILSQFSPWSGKYIRADYKSLYEFILVDAPWFDGDSYYMWFDTPFANNFEQYKVYKRPVGQTKYMLLAKFYYIHIKEAPNLESNWINIFRKL